MNSKAQDLMEDAEEFPDAAKNGAQAVVNGGKVIAEPLVSDAGCAADKLMKYANRIAGDVQAMAADTVARSANRESARILFHRSWHLARVPLRQMLKCRGAPLQADGPGNSPGLF